MQALPLSEHVELLANPASDFSKQSLVDLQQAFSTFSNMSEQLSDSYHLLETRVIELSGELAALSKKRLKDLNEKEAIAEQLESLLRLMPAAVIVLDNKGVIKQANPTAEKFLKSAMAEEFKNGILNTPWVNVIRLAFDPKQNDYHEVSLRDGRLVSLETSPLDNSGQLIMMTDQTETRTLQFQVARQERLSAMGQMVASLAHQIRTPLSAAMLYASNLKNPKLETPMHDQFVDKMVGRLNHLEKQVQDMLLFVKGECQLINRISIFKLMLLLKESTEVLSNQKTVCIEWGEASESSFIQCQSDALVSALMNIINNAIEASSGSSSIVIKTAIVGDVLELSFRDFGPGMDSDQITKIQEPFFTTKSYGTGLGIPVLLATVKAHKGTVKIYSQLGSGTEFRVTLPIFIER